MKSAIYTIYIGAALALAAALPAGAQGLHESIGVDGKYVREVTVQERINTLPSRLALSVESNPLSYQLSGTDAAYSSVGGAMPLLTPFASRRHSDYPGYLQLGAGSWLNSTLSAGYRFADNGRTLAGIWLQHNSTSLWKPDEKLSEIKRSVYDESAGLYASHRFDAGTLTGRLSWNGAWYNYYGTALTARERDMRAPTQTLTDIDFSAGWHSPRRAGRALYSIEAGARYFGYRIFHTAAGRPAAQGDRETDIFLSGTLAHPWENGAELGLDLRGDLLLYNREGFLRSESNRLADGHTSGETPGNYGMVTLTPYYRFARGLLNIRIGARIDLAFNAGVPGSRYSTFHIAPDVRLDWRSGPVGLYLNAGGGSELQTLPLLHSLDYYGAPGLANTRPVYTPLDARAGANFGPFAGFSAGFSVAWRISRRQTLGGWYAAYLDYGTAPLPGMTHSEGALSYCFDREGLNMSGISLGLKAEYRLGTILEIKAAGSYQPQDGKKGYFNGYDRPRWTLDATVAVRPVRQLTLSVGYRYRGVRRIYTQYGGQGTLTGGQLPGSGIDVTISQPGEPQLASLRLPDLTWLDASVSWRFSPRFGIFAEARNLLGRHDAVLPCLPAQGAIFAGGLDFLF